MTKRKLTKNTIIKTIADNEHMSISSVRSIYNKLEQIVVNALKSVNELDDSISIKLFEGITVDANYIPEKQKQNNLSGEIITVASHIKPKANITRSFCEKLNS